jgi:hypothetical protein
VGTDVTTTRANGITDYTTDPEPSGFTWTYLIRVLLTIGAAACFIVGAFTAWMGNLRGNDLSIRFFYSTDVHAPANFFMSGAILLIALAILALAGLAVASGWPTRLAGALGLVAFLLLVVELYRSPTFNPPQDIGLGMWLTLAGALLALFGGVIGTVFTRKQQNRTIVVP